MRRVSLWAVSTFLDNNRYPQNWFQSLFFSKLRNSFRFHAAEFRLSRWFSQNGFLDNRAEIFYQEKFETSVFLDFAQRISERIVSKESYECDLF